MRVKVIGRWQDGGPLKCGACIELRRLVRVALDELGLKETVVEECASEDEYKSYGIIPTPLLVINGKVKLSGRVPPKQMLKELIKFEMEKGRKK